MIANDNICNLVALGGQKNGVFLEFCVYRYKAKKTKPTAGHVALTRSVSTYTLCTVCDKFYYNQYEIIVTICFLISRFTYSRNGNVHYVVHTHKNHNKKGKFSKFLQLTGNWSENFEKYVSILEFVKNENFKSFSRLLL